MKLTRRFLALLLAFSMSLSMVTPAFASETETVAEETEAVVEEIIATEEAAMEGEETTEASDPEETTEASEPEETTEASEPEESTEASEPEETEPVVGSEENPYQVTFVVNEETNLSEAEVTVPANTAEFYCMTYDWVFGKDLYVNGEFVANLEGSPRGTNFVLSNETEEEVVLKLHVEDPLGSANKPDTLTRGDQTSTIADAFAGYCYTYTAEADGVLVFEADTTVCDVSVSVTRTSTDENGETLEIPVTKTVYEYNGVLPFEVKKGEVLSIVVTGNVGEVAWSVDYAEGHELNPMVLEMEWDEEGLAAFANVSVYNGSTMYYVVYAGNGLVMKVVDAENNPVIEPKTLNDMGKAPQYFSLTAPEAAEGEDEFYTYTVILEVPVGHMNNPDALTVSQWESTELELAEAMPYGYHYTWTSDYDGILNIEMLDSADGWYCTVNNLTKPVYGDVHSSYDSDANAQAIPVSVGDEIEVIVNTCGAEGKPVAGTVYFNAYTGEPKGSQYNPIIVSNPLNEREEMVFMNGHDYVLTWNEEATEATVKVSVPAETTYYFNTSAAVGMTLSVNGENPVVLDGFGPYQNEFVIENATEADAEYDVKLYWAVGAEQNPAALKIGETNIANVPGSGGAYFYTWTAEADGTLTVDFSADTNWAYTINDGYMMTAPDSNGIEELEVVAGETVTILVSTANYMNDEIAFTASFVAVEGHKSNPYIVTPEEYNDAFFEPGQTNWFSVTGLAAGMELTVYANKGATMELGGEVYKAKKVTDKEWDYTYYVISAIIPGVEGNAEPVLFSVTNNSKDEYWWFDLYVDYAQGHENNPASLKLGSNSITLDANDTDGYTYGWRATADGLLEITMPKSGWQYFVTVNGVQSDIYDYKNDNKKQYIEVEADDWVQICVNTCKYGEDTTLEDGTILPGAVSAPGGKIKFSAKLIVSQKDMTLIEGKSTTLKVLDPETGKAVSVSEWKIEKWGIVTPAVDATEGTPAVDAVEGWVDASDVATIKKGKLTAKKTITEPVEVRVTAKIDETTEYLFYVVLFPAADSVSIIDGYVEVKDENGEVMKDENGEVITEPNVLNGKTIELVVNDSWYGDGWPTLEAIVDPDDAMGDVTWSSSKPNKVMVNQDGELFGYAAGTGSAKITATANDGSGKKATVTVKYTTLMCGMDVYPKTGSNSVASGKSLAMAINYDTYATNKKVTWSLYEAVLDEYGEYVIKTESVLVDDMGTEDTADDKYEERPVAVSEDVATISSKGKITAAKNLTERHVVIAYCEAQDGGGASSWAEIYIEPKAASVDILNDNDPEELNYVSTTLDLHDYESWSGDGYNSIWMQASANDAEGKAIHGNITWKSSNTKVAYFDEYSSYLNLTGKTGKVTITATANDGSGVKATLKINVVKGITEMEMPYEASLAAGKSMTLKPVLNADATAKTINWTLYEAEMDEYGMISMVYETSVDDNGTPEDTSDDNVVTDWTAPKLADPTVAKISSKGKVTAGKKLDGVKYVIAVAEAEVGNGYAQCAITLNPVVTKKVSINNIYNRTTICFRERVILGVTATPEGNAEDFIWKSSNEQIATVQPNTDNSVTVVPTGLKAGKVTITATANDGSKKSAKVTINVVSQVKLIQLDKETSVMASKTIDLNKLAKVYPASASNKKLTWTLTDAEGNAVDASVATLKKGKLTANKNLAEKTVVYVTAVADDGYGAKLVKAPVTLYAKTSGVNLYDAAGTYYASDVAINGKTIDIMDGGIEIRFAAENIEDANTGFTYKLSNTKNFSIKTPKNDGTLIVAMNPNKVKYDDVTLTVTANDGSKASAKVVLNFVNPAKVVTNELTADGEDASWIGYDFSEVRATSNLQDSENHIDKIVTVTNNSKQDVYIRTLFALEDTWDASIYAHHLWNNELGIIRDIVGENDWMQFTAKVTDSEDKVVEWSVYTVGYIPYEDAIKAGETSAASLLEVWALDTESTDSGNKAPSTWENDFLYDGKWSIIPLTQAVPVNGNEDAEAALNAVYGELTSDRDAEAAAWFQAELEAKWGEGYTVECAPFDYSEYTGAEEICGVKIPWT